MWIGDSVWKQPAKVPLFFNRMRDMGIDTGMVFGDSDPKPLLDNQFPYYVENIVNKGLCLKFNAKVTDWDKFVTDWVKEGRPESAFVRDYCLDDPQWRNWAREQVQKIVRKNLQNKPLAYNIRDELSTTYSANPFDYDYNPIALSKFREWLKLQYKDLSALNAEWETHFASWDDVKPFSTDQIKNRMASGDAIPRGKPDWGELQNTKLTTENCKTKPTRFNFAPWCDFRSYMDTSLANALNDLRQASHQIDPQTPVGIEGTQMPNTFGGYDLWKLSQALDWVEPYDIGSAREIFGSFMPGKSLMTTVFENKTEPASRRLWHLLLEGDRGCIIWWSEDSIDWASADYALTGKAKALAPVLKELHSPIAELFLRAEKEYDPIGITYSQSSIQVNWLFESTRDGSTWHRRFSSFEADANRMVRVVDSWAKAFQDLGYSPRFVSTEQLKTGADNFKVLVMPNQLATGETEERWLANRKNSNEPAPDVLFFDGTPGLFDEHGKLRSSKITESKPLCLSENGSSFFLQNKLQTQTKEGDIATYVRSRLNPTPAVDWAEWIRPNVPVPLEVTVPLSSRTRIHRYKLGNARLIAFERNISYQMSEDLKQSGGNEALEKPVDLEAKLAKPAHAYDLRTAKYLGNTDKISFHLDPWKPSLFVLTQEKISESQLLDWLNAQSRSQ